MRLIHNTNDKMNFFGRPMHDVLNMMFGPGSEPFITGWDWNRLSGHGDKPFSVPMGEGWSEDALHLRFSIPGVPPNSFRLTQQGNRLTLSGKRDKPEELDSFGLPYGQFERSLELSRDLDMTRMRAELHNGVLDVQIPLQDSVKTQAVPIYESAAVAA